MSIFCIIAMWFQHIIWREEITLHVLNLEYSEQIRSIAGLEIIWLHTSSWHQESWCCLSSKNRSQSSINSLWPNDAIWRQRSGSTLAQVMACCLTAPSHYLNQCWFTRVRSIGIHLSTILQEILQPSITKISMKITFIKFLWNELRRLSTTYPISVWRNVRNTNTFNVS